MRARARRDPGSDDLVRAHQQRRRDREVELLMLHRGEGILDVAGYGRPLAAA